uniref:Uncharacterized protein n=1 Tax=Arundo donax TaxID=35708 RepID=A0A0A9T763_ARUDO
MDKIAVAFHAICMVPFKHKAQLSLSNESNSIFLVQIKKEWQPVIHVRRIACHCPAAKKTPNRFSETHQTHRGINPFFVMMQVWDNTLHCHIVQFDINPSFTVHHFFHNEHQVFLFVFRNDCHSRQPNNFCDATLVLL